MGSGNKNGKELLGVLSMLNGKDGMPNSDALASLLGNGNNGNGEMLASLLGGGNPDITKLMGLYNDKKPKGYGLRPISDFASDEILGILLKYFL